MTTDEAAAWTDADSDMLVDYYRRCFDWLDEHGYRWDLVDRADDLLFLAGGFDDDVLPAHASAALPQRWRQFTVIR